MRVVYTLGEFGEIEITGDAVEWIAFALALEQGMVDIDLETVDDPSPYSGAADGLRVSTAPGEKVRFEIEPPRRLVVTGDASLLHGLAQSARTFGFDFQDGQHVHIEYQGEEHFIGRDSIPAVFTHASRSEDGPRRGEG